MNEETFFVCPTCLETVSILVDLSEDGPVEFVEDCEVCCHPNSIRYQVTEGALSGFQVTALEQ